MFLNYLLPLFFVALIGVLGWSKYQGCSVSKSVFEVLTLFGGFHQFNKTVFLGEVIADIKGFPVRCILSGAFLSWLVRGVLRPVEFHCKLREGLSMYTRWIHFGSCICNVFLKFDEAVS